MLVLILPIMMLSHHSICKGEVSLRGFAHLICISWLVVSLFLLAHTEIASSKHCLFRFTLLVITTLSFASIVPLNLWQEHMLVSSSSLGLHGLIVTRCLMMSQPFLYSFLPCWPCTFCSKTIPCTHRKILVVSRLHFG